MTSAANLPRYFSRLLRRFGNDRRGNIAVTFTFSLVPIVAGVGAAVDYSHANSVKAALQASLDATVLMLAKNAGGQTQAEMQTLGNKYFKANFNRKEAINPKIVVTYTQAKATIVVNGTASVKTDMMGILGFKTLSVAGTASAGWGVPTRLRVALVLDNTGSMNQSGKMPALQTAAKNMLARLNSASKTDGDVSISIIPFATDVNVGTKYASANWIDWYDWDANNGDDVASTTCTQGTGRNGRKTKRCSSTTTWVPASHSTWNGCVTDRDQNFDTTVTPPKPSDASLPLSSASTLFPADQDPNCPVAILPLTSNWAAINSLIGSMKPAGTTNQSIGLAWGWLSLTPGSVLNPPAKDPSFKYDEHIILFTDGLNTANRWYNDQAKIDARQKILCDNVKAAKITLWTIQVSTSGEPQSTLLQQCASDPAKFFMLKSSNEIISAFDNISFKITRLHLTK